MSIPKRIQIERFIMSYLGENESTDMTDENFNEQFYKLFKGSRHETIWGAQPNRLAARYLKSLYDKGILDRCVVSLGSSWQPGFPKWVYGYSIKKQSLGSDNHQHQH